MKVNSIYHNIGQSILNSIEEEWTLAKLNIDYVGSVNLNLNYISINNSEKSEWLENDDEISDEIKELHKITTEGGNNKWNRAIFTLKPDGDFDMEFIWDQELQDEVEKLAKE